MKGDHTDAEEKKFWSFNTGTIGEFEIPAMVAKIHSTISASLGSGEKCQKVQILTHGLASAEALVTLSMLPQTSARLISQLVNLSPCAILSGKYKDNKTISAALPPAVIQE